MYKPSPSGGNVVPLTFHKEVSAPPPVADPSDGRDLVISVEGPPEISADEAASLALTVPQCKALELIAMGYSRTQIAKAVGVNRTTLQRWFTDSPGFATAYAAWQKEILTTTRSRLLAISDQAITTVTQSIHRGDSRTALTVLKSIGALDRPAPDAEPVARKEDRDA